MASEPLPCRCESFTERRLAALRAEKKRRLQLEHGIERCEVCRVFVDVNEHEGPRACVSAGEDGGYLCSSCAAAIASADRLAGFLALVAKELPDA